jgi:hypothetical protein
MTDSYRGVKYFAFRRLCHAKSLGMESRFCKRNHLLRTMKMKIGLHATHLVGCGFPGLGHCDVPHIAKLIFHAALSIARDVVVHGVNRCGAGPPSPLIGGVGIVDIQMNCGWPRRMLLVSVSQLNHRIADADLRVHHCAIGPRHAQTFGALKSRFEEFNKPVGSIHYNIRRDIIETGPHK